MKFDLHIHSSYSPDGQVTPKEIVKFAKMKGLSGLSITDHNSVKGYDAVKELAVENDIILISGTEISTTKGHLLAYGIDSLIERGNSSEETIEMIVAQGGVCIIPHPYRFWSGIGGKASKVLKVSGIEVLNGRTPDPGNAKAKSLAKARGLPGTGGSDAHEVTSIGKTWTAFNNPISSEEEALEAIRKGEITFGGRGRDVKETVQYSTKALSEWIKRGFKRI